MDIQPISGIHPIEAVASVAKTRPIEAVDQEATNLRSQSKGRGLTEKRNGQWQLNRRSTIFQQPISTRSESPWMK